MAGGPVAAGGGIGGSGGKPEFVAGSRSYSCSPPAPKNKIAGILMTAFAAFGGILFGYDTGTISGIKEMKVCQTPIILSPRSFLS
jgi:hypothetical protein